MRRVIFLIDGFNVYHALDDNANYRKYKWLDYSTLAKFFVTSKDKIVDIFYFTAYAHWNPSKRSRHHLLIQALRQKGVKIIFGKFKVRDHKCRICKKEYPTFEEKQTDVNIAVKLFQCAINNEFDSAILITGDTDLIPAIEGIKMTFPAKQIGVVIPIGRRSEDLKNICDFHMKMKEKHLKTSQLPESIVIDPENNIVLK